MRTASDERAQRQRECACAMREREPKEKGKKEDNEPCVWNGRRLVLAFAFFSSPNLTHDELIHAGPRFSRLSLLRAQIIIRGTDGHHVGRPVVGPWCAGAGEGVGSPGNGHVAAVGIENAIQGPISRAAGRPVYQERFRVFRQRAGGAGIDRFGRRGGQARGVAVRL